MNVHNKRKILIIDDEEDLCAMFALRLQCFGFDTDYAFSGEDGLKKIASFAPHVILLDVVMPVMDGWEVCRLIKQNAAHRQIKVFMVTAAQSDSHLLENVKKAGADAGFLKPLDEEALLVALDKYI